jgi:hypothetical protein
MLLGAVPHALAQTSSLPPDLAPRAGPPRQVCRAGYLEFEAVHGLDGVRAAIQEAVAQNDAAALTFLGERLAEVLGRDASAALKVVGWAEVAAEPELSLYLGAVRASEAVHAPEVVSRLVSLAETHADPGHQAQALVALETQHRFEPALLERLTALARKDSLARGVVMHVVRTLGRAGENAFQRTGDFEPYMGKLLDVARSAKDKNVRTLAVEMATYPNVRLEDASVAGLAALMKTDPAPSVREMAALALSSGRDTEAVLRHFREAFSAEQNLCVRWALVRYAVRAGGPQALPLLEDFARVDKRFARDAADFRVLYASGLTDFDRVWLGKRVHHTQCASGEE